MPDSKGYSLLELIIVLVLVGIIGTSAVVASIPSATFQLQGSRDRVVMAFFSAQQRAMSQTRPVRLSLVAPASIDIREDSDSDGNFNEESSLRLGGVQYPVSLLPNQTISSLTVDFDRLGNTAAEIITLSQGTASVSLSISRTGYIR